MFLFNNSKRELISHIVRMIGNFLFQGKKKKKTRNFFKRRKERETQGEKEHIVKKINNKRKGGEKVSIQTSERSLKYF